jgi:hypothetical protein
LDFDGTIVPIASTGKLPDYPNPPKEVVDNLNLLVQATGAKVVVSSSWRFDRSVKELDAILKSWGTTFDVYDKIPTDDDEDRGGDILSWIGTASVSGREGVESFVVLDDEPIDLAVVAKHTVLVNPQKALQIHDVAEAVRILNERRPDD